MPRHATEDEIHGIEMMLGNRQEYDLETAQRAYCLGKISIDELEAWVARILGGETISRHEFLHLDVRHDPR